MTLCKYFKKFNNQKKTSHIKRAVNFVWRQDVVNSEILTTRLDEFWWTHHLCLGLTFFFLQKIAKNALLRLVTFWLALFKTFSYMVMDLINLFMHADNRYMWIVNNALRLHCMNLNNCALLWKKTAVRFRCEGIS